MGEINVLASFWLENLKGRGLLVGKGIRLEGSIKVGHKGL
jgi:hypothetical protein